jgi:hypothetical protein
MKINIKTLKLFLYISGVLYVLVGLGLEFGYHNSLGIPFDYPRIDLMLLALKVFYPVLICFVAIAFYAELFLNWQVDWIMSQNKMEGKLSVNLVKILSMIGVGSIFLGIGLTLVEKIRFLYGLIVLIPFVMAFVFSQIGEDKKIRLLNYLIIILLSGLSYFSGANLYKLKNWKETRVYPGKQPETILLRKVGVYEYKIKCIKDYKDSLMPLTIMETFNESIHSYYNTLPINVGKHICSQQI